MTTYNGASVVVRHSSGTFAASGLLREIQPQNELPGDRGDQGGSE